MVQQYMITQTQRQAVDVQQDTYRLQPYHPPTVPVDEMLENALQALQPYLFKDTASPPFHRCLRMAFFSFQHSEHCHLVTQPLMGERSMGCILRWSGRCAHPCPGVASRREYILG